MTDLGRTGGQKDDAPDKDNAPDYARRQFMERFGKLAIAAGPAVALLDTFNAPAMAWGPTPTIRPGPSAPPPNDEDHEKHEKHEKDEEPNKHERLQRPR